MLFIRRFCRPASTTSKRVLEQRKLVKFQPYRPVGDDSVLERALKLRRAERAEQGLEKAFQNEIEQWLSLWTVSEITKDNVKAQTDKVEKAYKREVNSKGEANGTGRRKSAVAQVWIWPGDGLDMTIKVVGEEKSRLFSEYFDRFQLSRAIEPFKAIDQVGKFNVRAIVSGGGLMGQAGALSLGIARALQAWDPEHRAVLKQAGLLTRDARVVERKKPGQKKARKKFQWVKR